MAPSSLTITGVRTTASGKSGWVTSREARATSPRPAAALQAGLDVRVDDRAEQGVGAGVVAEEAVDGAGQVGGDLVVGLGALVGADAVAGISRFCGVVHIWPL